ncbi:hypothetical protein [Staphylococcus americanisciuri]|uniref:Phage protein n=1 Tax=Staphylococcus americanisciuri TaxID=2973940 RepID=A0ABT2F3Z6_9STAP|nr:hypothetical protein [Staphylococcus americanisciuri]MCS4487208.1 hypothetical protein [Staphylococcus americanisciuri]
MRKVVVYEMKDQKGVYIASEPGVTTEVSEAYLIYSRDGSEPSFEEIEQEAKRIEKAHKKFLKERYGEDFVCSFQPYSWLKYADLVVVEVDEDTFEKILKRDE